MLCAIDIYLSEVKKCITITNDFQKVLNKSKWKPDKVRVDKGGEFSNRSMKSWLQDNDIELYSTHNEEKSVVAGRFIRNLKNKINKFMTSISKNAYIYKSDERKNQYIKTHHSTIKMKLVEVNPRKYTDFDKNNN